MDRSHLLYLKSEYDVLVNKHGYIVQETYMVQDPTTQIPPSEFLLLQSLHCLYNANVRNQEPPQLGDSCTVTRRMIQKEQTILVSQARFF